LTERTAQVELLAEKLRQKIPEVITLTGGRGGKESINLLSYGSAQESIMRLESPNIAQELLKDLGKSISA